MRSTTANRMISPGAANVPRRLLLPPDQWFVLFFLLSRRSRTPRWHKRQSWRPERFPWVPLLSGKRHHLHSKSGRRIWRWSPPGPMHPDIICSAGATQAQEAVKCKHQLSADRPADERRWSPPGPMHPDIHCSAGATQAQGAVKCKHQLSAVRSADERDKAIPPAHFQHCSYAFHFVRATSRDTAVMTNPSLGVGGCFTPEWGKTA